MVETTTLHKILKRQLKRFTKDDGQIDIDGLLKSISDVYQTADEEEYLSHQSLTMMSAELTTLNEDLREQMSEAKANEERYALASLGANDGLWDWDIENDVCFYSDRWKEIIGFSKYDHFTSIDDWIYRITPEHQKSVRSAIFRHLDGFTERFEAEYQIKCCDGSYLWVLSKGLALRDHNRKPLRIAGSQTDISQRKRYEEQLYKAAFHDKLTGLPNRSLFTDRVKHTLKIFKRSQHKKAALLFLDLDRFKIVNDSLGHEAGDQLLVSVARRLELTVRSSDTICRLGGDEFTILLAAIDNEEQATATANRIIEEISKPYFIYGQQIYISGSAGVVIIDAYDEPENIMRNADLAMYQAKHNGKGRVEVFEKDQYDLVYSTLQIETELRIAAERGEFIPYFQPIINLSNGKIEELEALVRWNHPQKGLIPPIKFIQIAEETGIIKYIGEYLFESICKQLNAWKRAYGEAWLPNIAINLSAKQVQDLNHLKSLVRIFKDSGLKKESIKFEVTESVIMDNSANVAQNLDFIKKSGFKLSIDDFGTGYSSLSYLVAYPFDYIKIDRSFISNIDKDPKKEKIFQAIIGLAEDLDLISIAEGVETEEELRVVQKTSCRFAQGYYFSKPLTCLDLLDLIGNGSSKGIPMKLDASMPLDRYHFNLGTFQKPTNMAPAIDAPKKQKLKGNIKSKSYHPEVLHS